MAELPSAHQQINSHPFAYTRVDYFSPFVICQKHSSIKRNGCLFTCLTSRAIHLELAADLTADSFITMLQHFLYKRSPILHIFSDNETNFVEPKGCCENCCKNGTNIGLKIFSTRVKLNEVLIVRLQAIWEDAGNA